MTDRGDQRIKLFRYLLRKRSLIRSDDAAVIEALIRIAMPYRKDPKMLAYQLIGSFGSPESLMNAPEEDLMRLGGLTEDEAAALRVLGKISVCYRANVAVEPRSEVLEIVWENFEQRFQKYRKTETSAVLPVNDQGKAVGFELVDTGTEHQVSFTPKKIIRAVLKTGCSSCVLMHNHPNDDPVASEEDIRQTRMIIDQLRQMDIITLDHYIYTENGLNSIRQQGELLLFE